MLVFGDTPDVGRDFAQHPPAEIAAQHRVSIAEAAIESPGFGRKCKSVHNVKSDSSSGRQFDRKRFKSHFTFRIVARYSARGNLPTSVMVLFTTSPLLATSAIAVL
jgi:hypothetical protein